MSAGRAGEGRRAAVIVAITAAWTAVYALATLALPAAMPARAVATDVLFLPGHALAAWALRQAWRAQARESPSWHGFGALWLSQVIGVANSFIWIATSAGVLPQNSVAYQAIGVVTTLLTLYGVARLVPFRRPGAATVPWLDIALLALASISIGWYFVGWPLLRSGGESTPDFAWWAIITTADTFAALLFVAAWTYPSERLSTTAAAWLGSSFFISAWGDIYIETGSVDGTYVSGGPVDILFALTILVTTVGAWHEVQRRRASAPERDVPQRRMLVGRAVTPLIATAAVLAPVLVGLARGDGRAAFYVPVALNIAFLLTLQWRQLQLEREIARTLAERFGLERDLALAQQFESLGRYAGAIAHDFNNVLSGIKGHLQLVRMGMVPPGEMGPVLATMEDAVERGVTLNRRLVGLVRGTSVAPEPVDLAALVRSVIASVRPVMPPGLALELSLPRTPAVTELRPGDADQLLLNLLINARDAMPEGGRLDVRVRVEDAQVVLEVEDAGTGIPAAIRDRIFEPLFTTKGAQRGTGLGLATVQAVVKAARGTIDVWSEEGRGTRFTVRLPRSAKAPNAAASTATMTPSSLPAVPGAPRG